MNSCLCIVCPSLCTSVANFFQNLFISFTVIEIKKSKKVTERHSLEKFCFALKLAKGPKIEFFFTFHKFLSLRFPGIHQSTVLKVLLEVCQSITKYLGREFLYLP